MEENTTQRLLKEWHIDASLPPTFNSAVWRRIEASQPVSIPKLLSQWLNQVFARPAVAASFVAISLLIGLGAGQVHASRDLRTTDVELQSRYIQSVDPYAKLPLQ